MRSRIGKLVESGGELYLTCEEVIGFLLEYLDHELEPEEERNFERHLAICPSCVAYLATYRESIRLARGAEASAPVPEPAPELVRAILAARGR